MKRMKPFLVLIWSVFVRPPDASCLLHSSVKFHDLSHNIRHILRMTGDRFAAERMTGVSCATEEELAETSGECLDPLNGNAAFPLNDLKRIREKYPFRYATGAERRKAALSYLRSRQYKGPPLNVVVLGKPASGKGTITPMLATAFRVTNIGVGNLLRSEAVQQTAIGRIAQVYTIQLFK